MPRIQGCADCAKRASTRRVGGTRPLGNRRVSARRCSRDGRRAPAPDGAASGEGWEHDSSLSPRLWMPAPPLGPRYLWHVPALLSAVSHFFRLVSVILRITAQPVLLQYLRTVVDGPRNYRNVRRRGLGPAPNWVGPARGRRL